MKLETLVNIRCNRAADAFLDERERHIVSHYETEITKGRFNLNSAAEACFAAFHHKNETPSPKFNLTLRSKKES